LRAAWSRQELHHWIASAARAATEGSVPTAQLSPAECENLRSLGYVDKCSAR